MKVKFLLPLSAALLAMTMSPQAWATDVSVTLNRISKTMKLTPKAGGENVAIGEPSEATSPVYTFNCEPGDYTADLFDAEGTPTGSIMLTVEGEQTNATIFNVSMYVKNTNDSGEWVLGTDFEIPFDKIKVSSQRGVARIITPVNYADEDRKYVIFPVFNGDSFEAYITPIGANADDFAPITTSATITGNITPDLTLSKYYDFTLTAPKEAEIVVSEKPGSHHYVPFIEHEYTSAIESGNDMVYTYRLPQSSNYNYRVTMPGCMTHAGTFNPSKGNIAVTEDEMKAYTPAYFNHDVAANAGYNYADIFLNINPQNHMFMQPDSEFQIVNLRSWQLTNSITGNYFLEPEYHYTVLGTDFQPNNSVIEIDDKGLIKAKAQGTAIVQVRYDALNAEVVGGNLWSAIWAENTGTFIVTVGDRPEGMASNMKLPYEQKNRTSEIDAEHDVFYYFEGGDGYDFTFTPEGVSTVTVASPVVDLTTNTVAYPDGFSDKNVTKNADGSYTVHLTFGRNIVCMSDGAGKSIYQVMSAKPMNYSVAEGVRTDNYKLPGDVVRIDYRGLFHPAGKLAAVYNQGSNPSYNSLPEGYDSNNVVGRGQQYTFPTNQYLTVTLLPDQKSGKFELKDGCLVFSGWDDKLGGHRLVDYVIGRNPNFTAVTQYQLTGVIPNIAFDTDEFTDGLELSMKLEVGKKGTPVSVEAAKVFLGDDMTMTSSDPEIATIDETGKVTAVSDGTAVITYASAAGDKKFTCSVDVWSIKVEGITFPSEVVEATSMVNGMSIIRLNYEITPANATNKKVTYILSNPDIVDVRNGSLYTKQGFAGETDVTVTTVDGGFSASCHLILHMDLYKLHISKEEATISVGGTLQLEPVYEPEDTDPRYRGVTWSSSDPAVASVDENGCVTALAEGTADIAVISEAHSRLKAKCTVTVTKTSGIEDVSTSANVNAWPNPFTDYITVDSAEDTTVSIYSLQGRLLLSTKINAGQTQIDTTTLLPGIYLVRVGTRTLRMIRR